MYYFCGGMIRSGSTWQYNIVKELLTRRKLAKPYGYGFIPDMKTMGEMVKDNGDYFVKLHEAYEPALEEVKAGKAKAIYIYRDLKDVAASLMVRHKRSLSWVIQNDHLLKAHKNYQRWLDLPDVKVQRYEDVMANMKDAIIDISGYLQLQLLPGELEELSEKYSMKNQKEVINNIKGSNNVSKVIRKMRRRIGNILHVSIGKEKTKKIARYFGQTGIGKMDADTLLMSEHINKGEIGSYKQVMTKKEIIMLNKHLNTFQN